MLRDLAGRSGTTSLEADVLVVGAGIAGLLLATRLTKSGLSVVVAESGGEHQEQETHELNEVVQLGSNYQGAAHGRFRCLGGTSTRWGGAMIPFLPSDLSGSGDRAWPFASGDLAGYQSEVERLFQLPSGPYDRPDLVQSLEAAPVTYLPRLAKWPAFSRRNVARLLSDEVRDTTGPEIWLNATITSLLVNEAGNIGEVLAEALDGSLLRVAPKHVVLAAGAIESTRLLLLADRRHDGRLFGSYDILGRNFHDHLSVHVGAVEPHDRKALNRLAGFRFEDGGMRNLRFEPSEAFEARDGRVAGFAHLVIGTQRGSGFDHLRDTYRALQKGRVPSAANMLGLAGAAPWLMRAAWWRQFEHRLLYPDDAALEVHIVIEQTPRAVNRIALSPDRVDRFGQPLATVDWNVGGEDEANLMAATQAFTSFWGRSTLSRLGTLRLRTLDDVRVALVDGGGIYHPGGSTRMGETAAHAVVDRDLKTFSVPNLTVVSTSTFPSGGGANPTMTLMQLALRAADTLRVQLQR